MLTLDFNLLKRLCSLFGPTGAESYVREEIIKELEPYKAGFDSYTDTLGSYIVHIESQGAPKLLVSAHMDEVGFMVEHINENGTLLFGPVGGFDPIILSSKRVVSENGQYGAIMSKAIHLQSKEERERKPKISELCIDINAETKENALSLVEIGELFTFDSDYVEFGCDFIKSKALDDRLGCTIMIDVIKEIVSKSLKPAYDLYFAFSTREEIGLSGAYAVAEQIHPDYAFIIESTAVGDIHASPDKKRVAVLGEGGALSFADGGTIYDRDFVNHIIDVCKDCDIPYQMKKYVSGGNDSANIQKSGFGTKVAVMSAPSRYIHSPSSVVHKNDLNSILNTLFELIRRGIK